MKQQTAIVTGASGNMGKAVVKKFIEKGYKVIATAVPGDHTAVDYPADQFETVQVDLSSETAAAKVVEDVVANYGAVEVAVLTVGGYAQGDIGSTTSADISKQYKLNFETAYHIARPVFSAMMKAGRGRIFLIGSKPGLSAKNGKGMVAYSLAKSLIFHLAELMNDEAKGKNIVTSVVVPSTIDTPQNRGAMPSGNFEAWVKPEQIAEVIYFYASNEADSLREPIIKVYNNS